MMSVSSDKVKQKAQVTAPLKVPNAKAARLNARDPKKGEPVTKESPEVSRKLGAPKKG